MPLTTLELLGTSAVFLSFGIICIVFATEISKRLPWVRSEEDTRHVLSWTLKIGAFGTLMMFIGLLMIFAEFTRYVLG
jgi:hypothetical protein